MTKLLENKTFRRLAGSALAVLLAVALMPHVQPAYGEGEATAAAATAEDAAFAEEPSDTAAEGAEGVGKDPADAGPEDDGAAPAPKPGSEGDGAGEAPEAAPGAAAGEPEGGTPADPGTAPAGDTAAGDGPETAPEGEAPAVPETSERPVAAGAAEAARDLLAARNLQSVTVAKGEKATGSYVYDTKGDFTLTVNGRLEGSIEVRNGARLALKGSGTIDGGKKVGSVIHVQGGNSKLVVTGSLTITGGEGGTALSDKKDFGDYRGGGGILVQRDGSGAGAELHFKGGTVTKNRAGAGGGIFIDRACSFTMDSGTISHNTATKHEGGGLYMAGSAKLEGGTISHNATETKVDWGGGGIFVESKGILRLGSSLITRNDARGLGGGISGCPHASIGIGKIEEGFALYGNTAHRDEKGWPDNEYLHSLKVSYNGKTYYAGDRWAKEDGSLTAAKAMDYYCTNVSYVSGYGDREVVWTGYATGSRKAVEAHTGKPAAGTEARDIVIRNGESLVAPGESLGLTNTKPAGEEVTGRAVTITDNKSSTHGGGIGCNGTVIIGDLGTGDQYTGLALSFKKELETSAGDRLDLEGGEFAFRLMRGATALAEATNDAAGAVTFVINDEATVKSLMGAAGTVKTTDLTIEEVDGGNDAIAYAEPVPVKLSVRHDVQAITFPNATLDVTYHTPVITQLLIDQEAVDNGAFTLVNTLRLAGEWRPTASKRYFGALEGSPSFAFTVKEIDEVDDPADVDLRGGTVVSTGEARSFDEEGWSPVDFAAIAYEEPGDHWYLMTEDSGQDPTVYAFHVKVTVADDKATLKAAVEDVYYAATADETALTLLEDKDAGAEFYNADESLDLALYSYSVHAFSNEPVDQQCLVDPKIIKQLDGRAIKADEFRFKLIQVKGSADGAVDWSDTSGPEISATTNDEFGMVDFDKANNVAGEGMDPCCLLFTAPGTYYYRVIEDADYRQDVSVAYSDQVITFTAVIELDEATGQLSATDLYYGYLDENGQNVRYREQYAGAEDKAGDPSWVPSAADFPTLNPDWHPTLVNKARPMDVKVRKTSVLDRAEGLEGATYGLFQANTEGGSAQGDVLLATATSDGEGWIYFEDVSLAVGNLYYFKEQAAPAGHTVSEFRSPYFYLEAQTNSETKITSYVMGYTDQRLASGAEAAPETRAADAEATPQEETATGAAAPGAPELTDDGTLLFTYDHEGGVYDEPTEVAFNKLDTRTHEWVEGAKLSVVEKDTGTVVAGWISGKAPEKLQKALNVGTTYVLREDEAPEGYQKAGDVEFVLDAHGKVEILAGAENGNASLSDGTITLYDTRLDGEEVVKVEREKVRELPETGKLVERLAKTGDGLPLMAVGLLALAALAVAALARRRSRESRRRVHRR